MSITYSFDATRGMLFAQVTGLTTLADIENYFLRVSHEPWFPVPALTDVRTSSTDISTDDVRAAADRLRRLAPRLHGAPIAILTASPVSFGLSRMIEQLLGDEVNIQVFRDEPSALAWLTERQTENSRRPTAS